MVPKNAVCLIDSDCSSSQYCSLEGQCENDNEDLAFGSRKKSHFQFSMDAYNVKCYRFPIHSNWTKNYQFSAYYGIDNNFQRDIEVMCDLEIEWIEPDMNSTEADLKHYAACEIIQPKFQKSFEYNNTDADISNFILPIETLGNCVWFSDFNPYPRL